ncbi:DNA phosphorothioation-dependent restriction protein DptG [Psychrobacillus sp. NPDC093200]|uniref:DNA phosphorothioation-dependent restriction protein DptG n=1 Tax=Psychrobacillus sp. NPDC093200 TaxID=3390656 RepID=UPI003D02CB7E
MTEIIRRQELKQLLSKEKHVTGNVVDILPFLTKRTNNINKHFHRMIGEYVRHITNLQVEEKSISQEILEFETGKNILSQHIAQQIQFSDQESKEDFIRFVDEYLFNQERINTFHPYLFNFIPIDKALTNEFGKYASFIKQTILQDNKETESFFKNKETDDILTEVIIKNLDILVKERKNNDNKSENYQPLVNKLSDLYQEDLLFLSKYKEYFIQSFPLLTHYYTFMYVCQLVYNFEQFEKGHMEEVFPFYFAFEWESITKRRKVADPIQGFKYVQDNEINLFPHIHTLSQLSHNELNKARGVNLSFMTYSDIYKAVNTRGPIYAAEFLTDLNSWINDYSNLEWTKVNNPPLSSTIEEGFRTLFALLKQGTNSTVSAKYGKNIEDLGSSTFLKRRGSIGYIFNLQHDFILLLVAVCVKDKRIPLNQLYKELEKRGIALDHYSKQELLNVLDSHNILEKKSDSGDAQYVKPIL